MPCVKIPCRCAASVCAVSWSNRSMACGDIKSASLLQVVVGVVYNPVMDEMFTAIRGKGAFLNGSPIRASSCSQLGSALAITEIGVTRDEETLSALFGRISALTKQVMLACLLHIQDLAACFSICN